MLVVEADLLGLARVEAAAAQAGRTVRSVTLERLFETLEHHETSLVVVDLDRGRGEALDGLDRAKAAGILRARVVAYVSHVDEKLGAEARSRGYETWPRGRFWRSLEALFRSL